jgi:hypothetical protein
MIDNNYFDLFDIDDQTELPEDNRETDKKAMHAVAGKFNFDLEWLFRPQNDQDDYGIDGFVEIKLGAKVTGKMIAVQIKGSEGKFKEEKGKPDHFVYYGKLEHYYYWIGHSLSVILILHNVKDGNTYWVHVTRESVKGTPKAWKIYVPYSQKLDVGSKYPLSLISKTELEQKLDPFYRYIEIIAYLAKLNENFTVKAVVHETAKGAHLNGVFVNLHVYHQDGSEVHEDYMWIEYPEPLKTENDEIPIEFIISGLKSASKDWAFVVDVDGEIVLELNELAKAFLKVIKFARPQLRFLADSIHTETRPDL